MILVLLDVPAEERSEHVTTLPYLIIIGGEGCVPSQSGVVGPVVHTPLVDVLNGDVVGMVSRFENIVV